MVAIKLPTQEKSHFLGRHYSNQSVLFQRHRRWKNYTFSFQKKISLHPLWNEKWIPKLPIFESIFFYYFSKVQVGKTIHRIPNGMIGEQVRWLWLDKRIEIHRQSWELDSQIFQLCDNFRYFLGGHKFFVSYKDSVINAMISWCPYPLANAHA